MIDALFKYEFPPKVIKTKSAHVTWLLSASRDRKITLWKLIDGKIMKKSEYPTVKTAAMIDKKRVSTDHQQSNTNQQSQ